MFTNISSQQFESSVLVAGISDHHAQVGIIRVGDLKKIKRPVFKMSRSFSEDNIRVFIILLQKESLYELLSFVDIDVEFEAFMSVIKYNFGFAFPEKKIKI